jgi:archaeal type IV pilus assembly protein PilA
MNRIFSSHSRATAPVIANVILVAMAVVGGTITVVFAQGIVNSTQVSGFPQIELVQIPGFDGRDAAHLEVHDGNYISAQMSGNFVDDGKKGKLERLVIYVKNDSPKTITISELSIAGDVYPYSNPSTTWIPLGTYAILPYSSPEKFLQNPSPQILSGQEVTIICSLDEAIKLDRSFQFRVVTGSGSIWIGTIKTGVQDD